MTSEQTIQHTGPPTGLHDSNGRMIYIGEDVRMEVTGNTEVHGEWAIYRVEARGMVPTLSYLRSEKGQVYPEGYSGSVLSDYYDRKMLLMMCDLDQLRPRDIRIEVMYGDAPAAGERSLAAEEWQTLDRDQFDDTPAIFVRLILENFAERIKRDATDSDPLKNRELMVDPPHDSQVIGVPHFAVVDVVERLDDIGLLDVWGRASCPNTGEIISESPLWRGRYKFPLDDVAICCECGQDHMDDREVDKFYVLRRTRRTNGTD